MVASVKRPVCCGSVITSYSIHYTKLYDDIAVPRDIEPSIAELPNVFLYDIDDLEGIVESNMEMRRGEAIIIERMIEEEIAAFTSWLQTLGVQPVIRNNFV